VTRPAPPVVTVTGQTRVSYDVRVDGATSPFWFVLGQSHNDGWHARLDGHDLGAPTLIDGYANGWRIAPPAGGGTLTLALTWMPQRLIWFGLAVSVVAVTACLVLLVVGRRRPAEVPPPVAPRRAPATAAVTTLVLVGFTLLGGPAAGVAAALAAVVARRGPPRLRRWLPVVPAVLMAVVAAYVVAKTVRYPIPADLNWPDAFSVTDPLAWAAVAVAVALVVAPQCGAGQQTGGIVERQRVGAAGSAADASDEDAMPSEPDVR